MESLKSIGKILMVMLGATAVLLFLLAFLVQKLQWGSSMISIGVSIVYVISCFAGGFLMGKVQKNKKYIWGLLLGMMYIMTMLVLTMAVKKEFTADLGTFTGNLLLCLGSGMLGGMLS